MAWIEVHDTLREHRKIYALAAALKVDQATAIGIMVSLWTWAINNAADGDLVAFPDEAIARACFWNRKPGVLRDALVTCGFVVDGCLNDWNEYAGRLLDKREANARRNREARARSASRDASRAHHERITSASHDGATVPNQTVPNQTVPYESTERGADAPPPSPKASKPERHEYGQYGWVKLTDAEHAFLIADLGEAELARCIQYVDESAQSSGNKNAWKDWNLVLRRCSREKWGMKGTPAKKTSFHAYDQGEADNCAGPDLLAEARAMHG